MNYKDSVSFLETKNLNFILQIEEFFESAHELGLRRQITFKNGINISLIRDIDSVGKSEVKYEMMPSKPNPFEADVYRNLSAEDVAVELNKLSSLPENKNEYSFSDMDKKLLISVFKDLDYEQTRKRANELFIILNDKKLIVSGFSWDFETGEFGEIGFMPDNKKEILKTIIDFKNSKKQTRDISSKPSNPSL